MEPTHEIYIPMTGMILVTGPEEYCRQLVSGTDPSIMVIRPITQEN